MREALVHLEQRIDRRITTLEEKMDRRFEAVDGRFTAIDEKLDRRFASMEGQITRLTTTVVTALAAIVAVAGGLLVALS